MADTTLDDLVQRARRYHAAGYDFSHAFELAAFETRVERWPEAWGQDLVAIVYGDFTPPAGPLVFARLGVTIDPDKLEGTIVKSAMTALPP